MVDELGLVDVAVLEPGRRDQLVPCGEENPSRVC